MPDQTPEVAADIVIDVLRSQRDAANAQHLFWESAYKTLEQKYSLLQEDRLSLLEQVDANTVQSEGSE